jgi:ribonuclease HI
MANSKIKFYAVAMGRCPGIYDKWFGGGGAEAQVNGFPQARYQAFSSRVAAREWLKEFQIPVTTEPLETTTAKPAPAVEPQTQAPAPKKNTKKEPVEQKVIIYTDGGCMNNPGPGGYGVVLLYGKKRKELSGGYRKTTNNRMELMACLVGLNTLKFPCSVDLYSDSQYVVNGIRKGWARRWRANKWMRNQLEPAENADLWSQLLDLCDRHRVQFNWVRGHAGNRENERCDQLATQAASRSKKFLIDTAYETGQTHLASVHKEYLF